MAVLVIERADHEVGGMDVAEDRRWAGRAVEDGDRWDEPFGLEAEPVVLAVPDFDDSDAFVGGAGGVDDQSGRSRVDVLGGVELVVLPARGDVLNAGVGHILCGVCGFGRVGRRRVAQQGLDPV